MLQAHAANVLAYVGQQIGGGFWKQVMIVAVLGGTLASLQAAIVSSSRISFAMGRDRVFPRFLGTVSERHQTPWNATIRRTITASAGNLILGGIRPGLGAAFMAFVIIYSLATDSLDGVEIAFGFGFAAAGLIASFVAQRAGRAPFYATPAASDGDPAEAGLAGP